MDKRETPNVDEEITVYEVQAMYEHDCYTVSIIAEALDISTYKVRKTIKDNHFVFGSDCGSEY